MSQYAVGTLAFLYPTFSLPRRVLLLPYHQFVGLLLTILPTLTASLGLLERLTFTALAGSKANLREERLIANALGVTLVLATCSSLFALVDSGPALSGYDAIGDDDADDASAVNGPTSHYQPRARIPRQTSPPRRRRSQRPAPAASLRREEPLPRPHHPPPLSPLPLLRHCRSSARRCVSSLRPGRARAAEFLARGGSESGVQPRGKLNKTEYDWRTPHPHVDA